jgi:hypothetical protein
VTWHHRTCEHRVDKIEAEGVLLPGEHPLLGRMPLIWLTVSATASRAALGLSSHTLRCDRMAHLFRVVDEDASKVMPWQTFKTLPSLAPYLPFMQRLEATRGVRPLVWGVAFEPVRVTRVQ